MKKTYLVTGAAGFIGAAVAQKLVIEGHRVVTIDNLSTGCREHIPNEVEFIEGSVFDSKVIRLLEKYSFDGIIHIAGQSSGEISFEDPIYDLQSNCQSTLMLMEFARKNRCQKFIYASTMSVYGDYGTGGCTEDTELMPKSLYAVGKIASEHYMRIYSEQFGLVCTALRLFNVYGPGQNMDNLKQGMVSIYLAMALKGRFITVKGSKERFRDLVYIDDVVDAFVKSLERDSGYECMNVCTGKATTVEMIIKSIIEHLPYDIRVQYVDGTMGDQFGIYGNNERIHKIIGWKPRESFKNGIRKMICWARKNEDKNME